MSDRFATCGFCLKAITAMEELYGYELEQHQLKIALSALEEISEAHGVQGPEIAEEALRKIKETK